MKFIDLDKKDREILFHLSLNARAPLKEIAKKTNLSKEVVHYRIKKLEEKNIIQGYYAVINTYKLGKVFYRVYMKTINMSSTIEKEFLDFLKKHPKVTWVVEMDGDLNFLYVIWANNINEFEKTYDEINNLFGEYVQKKYFSVMTNVYYFKNKYLVNKKSSNFALTGGEINPNKLDDFDLKLVSLLSNEGRLSLLELAQKLSTNTKLVQRRMKKLEQNGIITCYNVKINHKALGYIQRKVMLNLNNTSQENISKLKEFIKNHRFTIYITIAIGQYDLEFEMMEQTHEDFHEIMKELKDEFPELIKEYFTVIFYDEPKVGQLSFE